jgi:site-specific DNA-methyltransferase (adenine-specific)
MDWLKPALTTDLGLLYHTDCANLLTGLRDQSIDCIFADPPFNIGKNYGNGVKRDELSRKEYIDWCYGWIDECVRVVVPGGAIFIYILPQWGFHLASRLEWAGMSFRHWIALSMKGSFPRGNKLYPAHYGLLYFTKGTPKTFNRVRVPVPKCRHCGGDVKDYGGHRKYLNPLGLSLTDFWDDTAPARHHKFKSRWHINELKPLIPTRCIEIATNPGEVVLDPFGGGGSTYEAAQNLNRYWLGTEIVTCAPIRERLQRHFHAIDELPPAKLMDLFVAHDRLFRIPGEQCPKSLKKSSTTEPRSASQDSASPRS